MRARIAVFTAVAATIGLSPVASSPAYAGTCAGYATPPIYKPGVGKIVATGTMRCIAPATGMTVTVCLEELYLWVDRYEWMPTACETTAASGATSSLTGGLTIDVPIYSTIWRTAVRGTNDDGDEVAAESAPVPWVNCACVIL